MPYVLEWCDFLFLTPNNIEVSATCLLPSRADLCSIPCLLAPSLQQKVLKEQTVCLPDTISDSNLSKDSH